MGRDRYYYPSYEEDGITVTASENGFIAPTLADSGGPWATSLTFTMDRPFAALSFDIRPAVGQDRFYCPTTVGENGLPGPCFKAEYDNVAVTGYRDGVQVAYDAFWMYDVAEPFIFATYTLGQAFAEIDALVIGFTPIPYDAYPGYELGCASPCTQYAVDNIVLAPVPVPASGALLAGALAGVGLMRRGRR